MTLEEIYQQYKTLLDKQKSGKINVLEEIELVILRNVVINIEKPYGDEKWIV